MLTHDFHERLSDSEEVAKSPWLKQRYIEFFPTLQCGPPVTDDGWAQRAGVDRNLVLRDGTIKRVDEKFRFQNYPDILLEYISSDIHETPGWIEKELYCDYIVYVFVPTQQAHFYDFRLLKRAWEQNKEQWKVKADYETEGFKLVPGKNKGYRTWSVAVPIETLDKAMNKAKVVGPSSEVSTPSETEQYLPAISEDEFPKDDF